MSATDLLNVVVLSHFFWKPVYTYAVYSGCFHFITDFFQCLYVYPPSHIHTESVLRCVGQMEFWSKLDKVDYLFMQRSEFIFRYVSLDTGYLRECFR